MIDALFAGNSDPIQCRLNSLFWRPSDGIDGMSPQAHDVCAVLNLNVLDYRGKPVLHPEGRDQILRMAMTLEELAQVCRENLKHEVIGEP